MSGLPGSLHCEALPAQVGSIARLACERSSVLNRTPTPKPGLNPGDSVESSNMAKHRNALLLCDGTLDIPDQPRQQREGLIRKCAYYKALQRRFTPGRELEDWLAAEREVDDWLKRLARN